MRKTKLVAVAAALCGLVLTGAGTAAAAVPATAQAPQAAAVEAKSVAVMQSPISIDRPIVAPGETLTVTVNHGPEALTLISSAAFTGKEDNPYSDFEGVAYVTSDVDGVATATATIEPNMAPGVYEIGARIGGSTVAPITVTVQ